MFATELMEGAAGVGKARLVNSFVSLFLQITTGTLRHSPPHHPTCTLPPFRVRPALTSPFTSRQVPPMESFWKTWATPTSSVWS